MMFYWQLLCQGTHDDDGTSLSTKQVVPVLTGAFVKQVIGCNKPNVKCGMTQTNSSEKHELVLTKK
ncbi:hypothetical protein [uncultured Desulfobacter sp.]|uniref:hypothetical protein n=1 Tax=uncultured Desulfobacter sp. TaxID=240139 RepID=UPI002AA64EB3|nr:hypothetical protein [uncultured Desulfobacter sp.]